MENLHRRTFIKGLLVVWAAFVTKKLWASDLSFNRYLGEGLVKLNPSQPGQGNFAAIYHDPVLKEQFFLFFKNVYTIFPENDFHALIEEGVNTTKTDQEVYLYIQKNLKKVKPFLADLTYSLPSLKVQKEEMARQTFNFIHQGDNIENYLEIGSPGRYISKIKDHLKIKNKIYLLHWAKPTYSPVDIMERGQLTPIGDFIDLNNYEPHLEEHIPMNSVDVVTNYIGFHHSPGERRDAFVDGICNVMKPGGKLLLRDHDVNSPDMERIVALAHDVFNAGLNIPWETNYEEVRHFTSIAEITTYLESRGFKKNGTNQFQPGDPTHNALMEFVKI
ncbi:class I SAM-dependent methyltransferase [bacterium]|nr:class I SAM-dependent methyltransferase [bacterium]